MRYSASSRLLHTALRSANFASNWTGRGRASWTVRRRLMAILRLSCMSLGFKRKNRSLGSLAFGGGAVWLSAAVIALGFGFSGTVHAQDMVVIKGEGGSVGICEAGSGVSIGGIVPPCMPVDQQASVRIGNNETGANVPVEQRDVFIGDGAGQFMTGADNVVVGTNAGAGTPSTLSSVSNTIAIGTLSVADFDGAVAIGQEAVATGGKAVSIGVGNVANGNGAVAIGDPNTATGNGAIAQGMDNTATGDGSVALGNTNLVGGGGQAVGAPGTPAQGAVGIGYQNVATGRGAVAIGDRNAANGIGSVAVGAQSSATGTNVVAIGNAALATGSWSTAVGGLANAIALASTAIGEESLAAGQDSTALSFRAAASGAGSTAVGAYASATALQSVALGTYGTSATGISGTAVGAYATASGDNSTALGVGANASGTETVAVGQAMASAVRASGVGAGANATLANTTALGAGAQATASIGDVALGSNSVTTAANPTASTIINGTSYNFAGTAPASVVSVGAAGAERQVTNVAAGRLSAGSTDAINGSQLFATNAAIEDVAGELTHYYSVNDGGTQQANHGNDGAVGANSLAAGVGASATQPYDTALGSNAAASGGQSVALGTSSSATGNFGLAIGPYSIAGGQSSTALGALSIASGSASIAVGDQAIASGDVSIAVGQLSSATATGAHAFGYSASATGVTSTAVGQSTTAGGAHATAIGGGSKATGADSFAGGYFADASGDQSIAIGLVAQASASHSTAIGLQASATGVSSVAIGDTAIASNSGSIAIGKDTVSSGSDTIAIGTGASATNSVALGAAASAGAGGTALGDGANATLAGGVALGKNSIEGAANPTASGVINGTIYNYAGTTPTSVVSVGSVGAERQVTNVAAGRVSATSTDAINGSQLFATNEAINNVAAGLTHYYSVNSTGGGNFANDGATGADAIASGKDASAATSGAIAMGLGATVGATPSPVQFTGGIAIGENASVTGIGGVNAGGGGISIGQNSAANGNSSVALGGGATAGTEIIGGTGATAIGGAATAANLSTAMGFQANAQGLSSIAIGTNAGTAINSFGATALGSNATAGGWFSTSLGFLANASVNSSVAIGDSAVASNVGAVALGAGSVTAAANPTASGIINGTIYNFAGTSPLSVVSLGSAGAERQVTNIAAGRISATSTDAINGSQLFATNSAIEEVSQVANAGWNVTTDAIGTGVVAGTSVTNVAPGGTATFTAGNNMVLTQNGTEVQIALGTDLTGLNSISIVNGPTINNGGIIMAAGNTLDMGGNKIINVAAGTDPTDGVNVSQLDSAIGNVNLVFSGNSGGAVIRTNGQTLAIQGVGSTSGSYSGSNIRTVTDPATGAMNIEMAESPKFGNVTVNDGGTGKITGVAAGTISASSQDAVNGSQLFALGDSMASSLGGGSSYNPATGAVTASLTVGGTTYNNVQDALQAVNGMTSAGWNVTTSATGTGVVSGSSVAKVAPGSTASFTAGNNIVMTQNGTNVQVAINPNLKVDSVTITNGPLIDNSGITMSAGDTLNMGGNKITNLATGTDPTDAVNRSQLTKGMGDTLIQANTYTDNRINALSFDLSKYNKDANGATAASMAMSQVPQAFEPGMGIFGAGVSTWQGEQGIAIGFSKASDNGRVIVKATGTYNTRGQGGAAAGVGFQF